MVKGIIYKWTNKINNKDNVKQEDINDEEG